MFFPPLQLLHTTTHSNNPCLCGDVPGLFYYALWLNAANTWLGGDCADAPPECSPQLPADWYRDNAALLELKALLAFSYYNHTAGGATDFKNATATNGTYVDPNVNGTNTTSGGNTTSSGNTTSNSTTNYNPYGGPLPPGSLASTPRDPAPLASWTPHRPACTSSSTAGSCVPCGWSDLRCGVVRPSEGALLCNYRFVSCRDRRVVGLHLSAQHAGLAFARLPDALGNLTALEVLDFGGNPHDGDEGDGGYAGGGNKTASPAAVLGGPLPESLGALVNLTAFGVAGAVEGPIPAAFSNWTKLASFRLARANVTGGLPAGLFTASAATLRAFTITDTPGVTGAVPDAIFSATGLQEVYLQGTALTGPAWFLDARASGLASLRALGFGRSSFALPPWPALKAALRNTSWGPQLTELSAPGCGLSGPVGPLAHYLPALAALDLAGNALTGAVPGADLAPGRLWFLRLAGNKLRGERGARGWGLGRVRSCD